jgi:uncharacterized protein
MAQNGLVPLMPHATAAWLVDNTALSFSQIAEFCGLHILEVQAMADDMTGTKYTGRDPVRAGELTMEEIEKGQANEDYDLQISKGPEQVRRTKGPRYTPVSEISDGAICKIIGTTRNTIGAIRDRSHWNINEIQAKDPVTLGLCSQRELDAIVARAAKKAGLMDKVADDTRFAGDRDALIEQLRAEREEHKRLADEALSGEGEAAPQVELTAETLFKKSGE